MFYIYWMKKALAILIFTTITLIANAQKNDTTIYTGCAFKNYHEQFIEGEHEQNISADQCPQFPGGDKKFRKFLSENLR
jgi:hypothetical protein